MNQTVKLNHVAFLVKSVEQSASSPALAPYAKGPAESFESEGTMEIYVGPAGATSRLLLIEAAKHGPYRRALEKRGPGLHHIAIDVLNLESYIAGISGSGWLLHPRSLHTIKASKTAYLARPGIPTLIEVQERRDLAEGPKFIDTVELPWPNETLKIVNGLHVQDLRSSPDQQLCLNIESNRLPASSFLV